MIWASPFFAMQKAGLIKAEKTSRKTFSRKAKERGESTNWSAALLRHVNTMGNHWNEPWQTPLASQDVHQGATWLTWNTVWTQCGPSADSFRPRCRWLHVSSQKFPVDVDILFEDSQPLWVMCNFFRGWVHKYCINPNHRGWPEALFRGTDLPLQLFTPSHIRTGIQGPFHHLHVALNTCPRTQVLELNYLSECLALQPCTVTDTLWVF